MILADPDDDGRQPRRIDPGQRQADVGLQLDRPYRIHARRARRYAGGQALGLQGLLFYGAAYTFMNFGAFAVVAALQKRTGVTSETCDVRRASGRREPLLGVLMTLFLLSLTGIPPLAGFFAKANVILAAVEAGGPLTILAVLVVLNAALAAFYYLRVVVYMYMRDPDSDAPPLSHGALLWGGLAAASALTILLGLVPTPLLQVAEGAADASSALAD